MLGESLKYLKRQFPFRERKLHAGSFVVPSCLSAEKLSMSLYHKSAEKLQRPKLRMKDTPLLEITDEEALNNWRDFKGRDDPFAMTYDEMISSVRQVVKQLRQLS